MRHLRSILYALVLAPAVWILCGVGFDQDLTGRARDNGGIESLTGMLLLLLAGAAYAILLFSPISPAGPLLAGLALLGVGAWARLSADAYAAVWPSNVAKDGFDLSTPGYGLVVLLAVPMVCTALSARRWAGFEPPQILLIGTIGRARGAAQVAGTTMASERTTLIATQRPAYQGPSADTTQVMGRAEPTVTLAPSVDEKTTVLRVGRPEEKTTVVPIGRRDEATTVVPFDDGEKTIVMRVAGPPTVTPAAAYTASTAEPSRVGAPAQDTTEVLGLQAKATEDVAAVEQPTEAEAAASEETSGDAATADATTRDVVGPEETTRDVVTGDISAPDTVTADTTRHAITRDVVASEEVTRDVGPAGDESTRDSGSAVQVTRDIGSGWKKTGKADVLTQAVASDEATEAVVALSDADGDEKTQVLRLPSATHDLRTGPGRIGTDNRTQVFAAAGHGEQTRMIRTGTVEPPGDHAEPTLPPPGEATTAATPTGERTTQQTPQQETTKSMSIVGQERPDPGEDPTTRLTAPEPGAASTLANKDRRAMTVTNLERPADEAADDTRPLTIPAPRQPADDDVTHKL